MDADLFFEPPAAAPRSCWRERLAAWHPRHWLGTLKARLAAGTLAALFVGIVATAWQMSRLAERDLLEQAQRRERLDAARAAAVIARRVAEMQHALAMAAQELDAATLADPARLAAYFDAQPLLRATFAELFATGPDGRLLLHHDAAGSRQPHASVAQREYFRRTVAQQRALVSEPLSGPLSGDPVVVFTQPLVDDDGVRGVLAGALRLSGRNLLTDLAAARDGEAELVVVADAEGRILAHPQRARLRGSLADEPRLMPAYSRLRAGPGRDGGAEAWTAGGQVIARAAVGDVGWQVWRAQPQDLLLAPVHSARRQALTSALAAACALAALTYAFLTWQLRPLARLERRAAALLHGDAGGEWPGGEGEIGRLSRTLRHVWAERAQVESFNAEVLRKLGSVMAAAPVGLAFTRHQRFELVSAEFCQLVGRAEHELVGQPTQRVFASNEDHHASQPLLHAAFARGEPYVGEWQLLRADGHVFWARLRARPVAWDDDGAGTIWSANDISDQVRVRQQLEHAALHDPLTGVANRKGFEHALAHVFTGQPMTRPASVVMIDLDHFKPINDSAGHAAGDAMLVAVAQAIVAQVRSTDSVARLGGDEFALLLAHCDHAHALRVAEKVRTAIGELGLPWDGRVLRVGASLGVAELALSHTSVAHWLADADAACYAAKRSGRGTVRGTVPGLRLVGGDG